MLIYSINVETINCLKKAIFYIKRTLVKDSNR